MNVENMNFNGDESDYYSKAAKQMRAQNKPSAQKKKKLLGVRVYNVGLSATREAQSEHGLKKTSDGQYVLPYYEGDDQEVYKKNMLWLDEKFGSGYWKMRKGIDESKMDFGDQLLKGRRDALKAKDAEKAVYYTQALNADGLNAIASFEKFKGSWAYEQWLKKSHQEIEDQKKQFKRFAYLGESKTSNIMKKSELRKIIAEAVSEAIYESNLPTGLSAKTIIPLEKFVQDAAQLDEDATVPNDTSKPYVILAEHMIVRSDIAEKILNLSTTRFSTGASANNFKNGDYAYFTTATYTKLGWPTKFKAELALKRAVFVPEIKGYGYIIATISGSYGSGGLQQDAKRTFSKRTKKELFQAAAKYIDSNMSKLSEASDMLGAKTSTMSPEEMQAYLGRVKTKSPESPSEKYRMPYVHNSNIEIKNDAGQKYDTEKLKAAIMRRPTQILKVNEKMGKSAGPNTTFFNIGLPALKGLAVNEKTGDFVVVDTCPGAGACKVYCYARKGGYVQYKDASMSQTRLLNYLLNDPSGFKSQFESELRKEVSKAKAKGKEIVVRWHDAGDFFSPEYLDLAYQIAKDFPDVKFYAYTKMAGVATGSKPDNFIMNFSMGATPEQEKNIDFSKTKHSTVVPKPMFDEFMLKDEKGKLVKDEKNRMQFKSDADLQKFKEKLAAKHNIKADSILTYDEMLETPVDTEKNKYNVIIRPGDGDISASRPDVKGTYLLIH